DSVSDQSVGSRQVAVEAVVEGGTLDVAGWRWLIRIAGDHEPGRKPRPGLIRARGNEDSGRPVTRLLRNLVSGKGESGEGEHEDEPGDQLPSAQRLLVDSCRWAGESR